MGVSQLRIRHHLQPNPRKVGRSLIVQFPPVNRCMSSSPNRFQVNRGSHIGVTDPLSHCCRQDWVIWPFSGFCRGLGAVLLVSQKTDTLIPASGPLAFEVLHTTIAEPCGGFGLHVRPPEKLEQFQYNGELRAWKIQTTGI
jgi:hypothetical protein